MRELEHGVVDRVSLLPFRAQRVSEDVHRGCTGLQVASIATVMRKALIAIKPELSPTRDERGAATYIPGSSGTNGPVGVDSLRRFEEAFMATGTPAHVVRQASTLSILWGVSLIVLGMLAIGLPMAAAVAATVVISWLLVLAGVVHLAVAFHLREAGRVIWRALVGLAYLLLGVYLIAHPVIGVASLTLVLASLFLVESIFDVALFFQVRSFHGSAWILFDGIITLMLGLLIYLQWPSSSAWAIGTLVGVSMIISGITRLMVSLAVRKATASVLPRAA
jgi:uncharacterized membrane protein HdeD (DUF308 family)